LSPKIKARTEYVLFTTKKVHISNKTYPFVVYKKKCKFYNMSCSNHRYRDEISCHPKITMSGQHISSITLEMPDFNTGSIPSLIHSTINSIENFSMMEGEWRAPTGRITTITARAVLPATGAIMIYTAMTGYGQGPHCIQR
jgi:hypothetical protein